MTCLQNTTYGPLGEVQTGVGKPNGDAYTSESECLQDCGSGACCELNIYGLYGCKTLRRCECTGVFFGVGTTCGQISGACCNPELGYCVVIPECECITTVASFMGIGTTCENQECNPLP